MPFEFMLDTADESDDDDSHDSSVRHESVIGTSNDTKLV